MSEKQSTYSLNTWRKFGVVLLLISLVQSSVTWKEKSQKLGTVVFSIFFLVTDSQISTKKCEETQRSASVTSLYRYLAEMLKTPNAVQTWILENSYTKSLPDKSEYVIFSYRKLENGAPGLFQVLITTKRKSHDLQKIRMWEIRGERACNYETHCISGTDRLSKWILMKSKYENLVEEYEYEGRRCQCYILLI